MTEVKEKINIHELIEGYQVSLVKTRIPAIHILNDVPTDEDIDVEDYEDKVSQPCFILWDDCNNEIREIFMGDKLTPQLSSDIADSLSGLIEDSVYEDVLNNFIPKEDTNNIHDIPTMYNYLQTHKTEVSEWETSIVGFFMLQAKQNSLKIFLTKKNKISLKHLSIT